jgi:hypothetical protein
LIQAYELPTEVARYDTGRPLDTAGELQASRNSSRIAAVGSSGYEAIRGGQDKADFIDNFSPSILQ